MLVSAWSVWTLLLSVLIGGRETPELGSAGWAGEGPWCLPVAIQRSVVEWCVAGAVYAVHIRPSPHADKEKERNCKV